MSDKASLIREHFPDQCALIDFLMAVDQEFLALCEDYDACVKAVRYWATSTASEAETRLKEYRTIELELHEEIASTLAKLDSERRP